MTRRLVAVGEKRPTGPTLFTQYAISDPAWDPVKSGEVHEPDPSDYRKQQIEEALARGEDL